MILILQLKNQLELNQINNINLDEEYKPLFEYPKSIIDFIINSCFVRYDRSGLSISRNKIYEKGFKNFNVQNLTSNLTKLNSLSLAIGVGRNIRTELWEIILSNKYMNWIRTGLWKLYEFTNWTLRLRYSSWIKNRTVLTLGLCPQLKLNLVASFYYYNNYNKYN
ncbi:hypothetical protein RhiirC2_775283 [Rhizophagus irregularis]|uniref:Uncharacterized protein n=1 Tax=Rhizophagus irregularis TaxID=588596 RepID=A0A2N1NJM5_9GLOM|nr:hypothetical protein RhiirC2_775283 [Rhizophagus irregularis]